MHWKKGKQRFQGVCCFNLIVNAVSAIDVSNFTHVDMLDPSIKASIFRCFIHCSLFNICIVSLVNHKGNYSYLLNIIFISRLSSNTLVIDVECC